MNLCIKNSAPAFLPVSRKEMEHLGWDKTDIILVSGDAYIDTPHIGISVIGRVLSDAGFRVGMISQPDVQSGRDITALGEPALFWGVSAGCTDSMIANFTASGKRRRNDDMTPGGQNIRRPDRALIVYANLIRQYFKNTCPIVLGGIEASLRRISHYDAWCDALRRSVLFDAKADVLVYGMGEKTVTELAEKIRRKKDIRSLRGICYIRREIPEPSEDFPERGIELPSHAEVCKSREAFVRMFRIFYDNTDPLTARPLYQKQDSRYLVQNPPSLPLSANELDRIYELPYMRDVHPLDKQKGQVRALETIRFSLTTHRGCYGECRFCAITVHQGRHVISRTRESLLREAASFTKHPDFKGIISDAGGPTANMYGADCERKKKEGACLHKHCLFPNICKHLPADHGKQIQLLRELRRMPKVRKVFIASGIRYDLILADNKQGEKYLEEILRHHVSGQLKIAPEHSEDHILRHMGKPGQESLNAFMNFFAKIKGRNSQKIFLTYYLMAAHPGSAMEDMRKLREFCLGKLHLLPEQVQIFTPSPCTWSTVMYYTERDPFTGEKLFVEKNIGKKQKQKAVMMPRHHMKKRREKKNKGSRVR